MSDFVDIGQVTVKRMSQKAALLVVKGNEHWVPLSQTEESTVALFAENAKLEECFVKKWIAEEEKIPFGE